MKRQNYSKLFLITLIFTLLFSNLVSAKEVNVYLENEKLQMPISALLEDGRTLVPMRAIFEEVGANVEWIHDTNTVVASKDGININLPIGKNIASVNGKEVKLDVSSKVVNGNTLVPIRFIAETLGFNTGWDNNTYSVLLDSEAPFGNYKVTRVVDGDTVKVMFNGKEESLRFIGVDTPESVHPDQTRNMPEGKIASDFTKKMLEGKDIGIEFDVQERDQYGRLLGYVHYNGEMFNKVLLEEGYAKLSTYPPNTMYVDEFTQLQEQARINKKGFWAPNKVISKEKEPEIVITKPSVSKTGAFFGSLKSDKYHYPSCRWAKKITYDNKIGFKNKTEAINMGYIPCKVCKP